MIEFAVERFKRLPQEPGSVWQAACFQIGQTLTDEAGRSGRPYQAAWVDVTAGYALAISALSMDPISPDEILDCLLTPQAAPAELKLPSLPPVDHRPGRIEVTDAALAEVLRGRLAGCGVKVAVCPSLDALEAMTRFVDDSLASLLAEPMPGPLDGTGVTAGQMAGFFDAARAFWKARPWKRMDDVDVLELAGDIPEEAPRFVSVLGSGGMTIALVFYQTLDDFRHMLERSARPDQAICPNGNWSVNFDPPDSTPPGDVELWRRHKWPVGAKRAIPYAMWMGPKPGEFRRPGPELLAYFEAVLRALAAPEAKHTLPFRPVEVEVPTWKGPVKLAIAPAVE